MPGGARLAFASNGEQLVLNDSRSGGDLGRAGRRRAHRQLGRPDPEGRRPAGSSRTTRTCRRPSIRSRSRRSRSTTSSARGPARPRCCPCCSTTTTRTATCSSSPPSTRSTRTSGDLDLVTRNQQLQLTLAPHGIRGHHLRVHDHRRSRRHRRARPCR